MGIDFRQHIVGLVSVFLSMAIGILVGVSLSSEESLEAKMEKLGRQFNELRQENQSLREQVVEIGRRLEKRAQFDKPFVATIVAEQLSGVKVALIYTNEVEEINFENDLAVTLTSAGAQVLSQTTLVKDFEKRLKHLNRRGSFQQLDMPEQVSSQTLAGKIGTWIALGQEDRLKALNQLEVIRGSGTYNEKPEAAVIFGAVAAGEEERAETIDVSLIDALLDQDVFVIASEAVDSSVSLIALYKQKGVTTVDNANTIPGQVAIVMALNKRIKGNFGIKKTSESLLPEK